jgi:DNA-binding response OmpR family regulator
VKALVVEDDAKVARLLSRVLQEEGFVVDASTSAADAITLGASLSYDLVVLDWMLPEGSGLEVCRTLRRKGISAPIIMLTARGEVAERVLGLEAGADDYVCKPFHVDELLARVHAVLRRSQGTVSRFAVGPLEIDRTRRAATLRGAPLDLTAREFTLLAYLAQRAGQVVSRTELLAHAWEARFDPGSNLVEVHVSRIRDKLGGNAGCIETVRGQGYRLRGEGAP